VAAGSEEDIDQVLLVCIGVALLVAASTYALRCTSSSGTCAATGNPT
jgi:hypothetical protein